ncbi:MAG: gliding motility-associated C-terminal domain-containing protein [Bacteroidetes bacterium]|nr:gliding motility-associated C-terminal domain-containing protein [Bacteroidota bacterium]
MKCLPVLFFTVVAVLGAPLLALAGPGTNGTATLCSNGPSVQLINYLGGSPDPGGTWSGPAGHPGTFFPATDAPGVYTYTVPGPPVASATVTVAVVAAPNAGTSSSYAACSNDAPFSMRSKLGGSPQPGGTWSPGGSDTFTPGTSLPGIYTYTVPGAPPCANATATLTIAVNTLPSAGGNGALNTCDNGPVVDLFTKLTGTPDAGGAWSLGGAPVSNLFTPGTSAAGTYVYTVNGTPPCPNASANVVVTVVAAPDAGSSRSITVCSDDAPFNMLAQLGGTPDAGGTWSPASTGTFTPGTSTPGPYTYTVSGNPPCADASAVLTITVREAPDAGTGRAVTVCSDGAVFNLVDSLGGTPDAGGTWTGPGGPHSGQFQPGTDPAGAYVYHVAGQAPCDPATATVTVTVRTAPNAGTSSSPTVCSNAAPFTLISQLGGNPAPGGSWRSPSNLPFPTGTFVPGTSVPGTYTYTVNGQTPCAPAVSTVTVSVVTAPNAGTSVTHPVCSSDATFPLFPLLGGTPDVGGTWTGPGGPVPSGNFTPGTSPPGVYTYTVVGTSPCANATATVTVNVVTAADAGSNGSVTLCSTSPNEDLFTHLGGTPDAGGTWTKPGGGTLAGGIYQPANPAHPAGNYTYTVTGSTPCPNVSALVQVVENQAPRAGVDGNTVQCSTNPPFNMGTVLGAPVDAGGSWINAANATVPATFTPGTTPAGVYRYVVNGLAPCANDTGKVTIQVNTAPVAGTNGAITVCSDDAPVDLFAQLGGTPDLGGTWKDPINATNNGSYVPGPGAVPGAYTYTVAGLSPCANASAVVTVTQHRRPVPGSSNTIALCSTDAPVNLFNSLGVTADAGGTWTGPGGSPSNGVFIPSVAGTFVYKYKVTGTAPCAPDSATVTVNVSQAPDAGTSDTITICSGQPTVDLFDGLGGTPDLNGTWTDLDATGRLSSHFFNPGTPTQLPPGDYDFRYVVAANGSCAGDTSTVRVTIVPILDAGNNGTKAVCSSQTQVNLFTGLGGTPQPGGEWIDLDGTGQVTGQYFNANGTGAGTFQFRYRLTGALGCNSDSAMVTVTVTTAPNPGHEGWATFCSDGPPVSLLPYISPAQANGTWRKPAPGNQVFSGTYVPSTFTPGDYTYTVSGVAPCSAGVAVLHISETQGPNAGNSAVVTKCANDSSFNMTAALGGTPATNGTWRDPYNQLHTSTFVPGQDSSGVYIYTVSGTFPCGDKSTSLTVNVNPVPLAGGDATITVCDNSTGFPLFPLLTGAQTGGTWYDPDSVLFLTGFYTPGESLAGRYRYVVTGSAQCGVAVGSVTVFEVAHANAGRDTSVAFCLGTASTHLVNVLGGPHEMTGTWTGPAPAQAYFGGIFQPGTDTPGTYIYHVQGSPPCANDSSAVTVSVASPPNAGQSRNINVCSTALPFAMVDSLGGSSPDLNGTWYRLPSGPVSNGVFTPGAAGTYSYRYTVQPTGNSPCGPVQSILTITVTSAPWAGGDGPLPLCSTDGITAMFPALTGNPQTGGTWSFNGASHSGNFDPVNDLPGNYRYTKQGSGGCANDTATVSVTVNQKPTAGSNGVLTICDDTAAVVLSSVLNGNPAWGGTWRDSGGTIMNGIYVPSQQTSGVHTFTYTVAGQFPCAASTAQATIIQNPVAYAGQDGSATACTSDPDLYMPGLLGGTGINGAGYWIDASNATVPATFTPGDHPAGTYVYRYIVHGDAPCVNDTAKVTITLERKPIAGVSTAPQLCTGGPLVPLQGLLGGTPDNSGSWAFVPTGGSPAPHGPIFDPAIDLAGAYVYTVPGSAACASASATVQVTLVLPPDAGTYGSLSACISETAVDLFAGLNGTPQSGGGWTDVDATGELSNGMFNASGVAPGTYHFRYTKAGVGPCPNDTATVAVTVTPELDAGADSTVTICSSGNVFLTTLLGGDPQPGGTWTAQEAQAQAGLINGVLNATQVGEGLFHFRYVLSGSANCAPDTARLTLTILNGPNAGADGNITTCSSSGNINLSLLIGVHDAGGTWYLPGTGGAMAGSIIDPSASPQGIYRYVVPAVGSCAADTAVVNVAIVDSANAGLNGTLEFCSNSPAQNLGVGLGGVPDPGGSWAFHPASGPPTSHSSIYNPLVDGPGNYVYTVAGLSPCPNAMATVFVTETPAPFAGDDNTYTFCSSDGPFQMISKLAGNPQNGGSWMRNGTPPVSHGPSYIPAMDSSGVFLYIRTGNGACANDTARLTVTEVRAPQAGTSAVLNVCPTDTAVNLFASLGPAADSTGIWTDGTGTLLQNSLFNATQVPVGTYVFTYTVAGSGPCDTAAATVTVNVGAGLNAGVGGNDTLCGAQTAYNLFQSLGGNPSPGGVWSEQTGVGAINGNLLNATALPPGSSYTLVYTLSDSACGQVQSVVLMYVAPYPDPGPDTSITVCTTTVPFPLGGLLHGADPGGTWTAPDGSPTDDEFDPATDAAGIYAYHLTGSAYCSDTLARVTIVVNQPANAGTDGSAETCNAGTVQLFPLLGGNAQPGGTWSDLDGSGALANGGVNADQLAAGQYHYGYRVDVTGCPPDSAVAALLVVDGVSVGNVQRDCDEKDRTYTVSFTITGGNPSSYAVTGGPGTLSSTAPYVFTSAPIFTSQPFAFAVDDENHCTPRTVEGTTPCHFQDDVFVPESFTPNGDGINDNFIIPGIEGWPDNNIVIFNRWGGEVYRANGYDNRHVVWNGSSPNALVPGDASTGTYYYVLDLGNGSETIKGFVYLNR